MFDNNNTKNNNIVKNKTTKDNNILISISGVSSSGKTTLLNELKEIFNIINNIIIKNDNIIISNQNEFELLNTIYNILNKKQPYNSTKNNINEILNDVNIMNIIKKLKNKVIFYNESIRTLYDNIQFKNMINNKEFVKLQLSILEKEIEKILYIKNNIKNKIIITDRCLFDISIYCILYSSEFYKDLTEKDVMILHSISKFCIETAPNIYNKIFITQRKFYEDDNYRLNKELADKEIVILDKIIKTIDIINNNTITKLTDNINDNKYEILKYILKLNNKEKSKK